jgi:hypothetical protein
LRHPVGGCFGLVAHGTITASHHEADVRGRTSSSGDR